MFQDVFEYQNTECFSNWKTKKDMKKKKVSKHRYNMRKASEAGVELSDKDHKYIYLRRVEFEEDEKMQTY